MRLEYIFSRHTGKTSHTKKSIFGSSWDHRKTKFVAQITVLFVKFWDFQKYIIYGWSRPFVDYTAAASEELLAVKRQRLVLKIIFENRK